MDTTKKVIWITGASSGIGWYLAKALASERSILAVSARRMELLEKLVQEIQQEGGQAEAFYCDVMEDRSIQDCVAAIIQSLGKLDIAIANAGGAVTGFIEKMTFEDWERQLRLNVTGLALTVKYALPELRKTKGQIVLVGSVAAYIPNPMVGAYGASKAAVQNIGETLQVELKGTGVSCTTIHPGFVDSNITRVDNSGHFYPEAPDPRPANLMWPTDKAARVMVGAIQKRKKVFVFTPFGRFMVFLGKYFPTVARKLMAKQLDSIMKQQAS